MENLIKSKKSNYQNRSLLKIAFIFIFLSISFRYFNSIEIIIILYNHININKFSQKLISFLSFGCFCESIEATKPHFLRVSRNSPDKFKRFLELFLLPITFLFFTDKMSSFTLRLYQNLHF